MWNLKYDTDELKEQKQTHRHKKTNLRREKEGKGVNQEFGIKTHSTICKIDNQQGPTLWHRELQSVPSNDL